ncbi:radical SAM/SPASM domain-containing protein [Actinoplanes philippinensis]|uniref:Radical SAM core domain-containing protein n=1 Tax=Actinoplanes philippinensis TaxID=35752 RepID=A0A1I1ZDS9_9ACTN|nr:radical SAM protein [Actinoplanes philippinensis]GIE75536.1 radical SAM/SPASM domain-containing protein [Actinoplanes philippinensis]SFE29911.1 uncharacterized protein SAMN05421541_10151 [Actinoplanes philippinensis]
MSLRPSRYTVVGDTVLRHPAGHLVRAVLHTATARVHLVDLDTAARLDTAATGHDPGAAQTAHDGRLAAAGLLVDDSRDEAAEVLEAGRRAARDQGVRDFVVMPSGYCNMGCDYCGQRHERTVVTRDHRSALAERVDRAARSGRYNRIGVRWFGGEPLMAFAVLRDLSQRFVASTAAAGIGYDAKVVTNGTLLDARKLRALHLQCRVSTIEVTLDGPAEAHDVTRPMKNGHGSFRQITAVIAAALAVEELSGLRFVIRSNVGTGNAGLAEPFAAALADAGLAHDRVGCYPAPVHPWGNDVTAVALSQAESAAAEIEWFAAYQRHGLRFSLLPSRPRPVVCAAVTRHSEVIAPDGRIYSCTEQPLVPVHADAPVGQVGVLDADALRPPGAFDDWFEAVAAGETGCRDCTILPLCGGACPKLWREGTPPCPSLRTNVRRRLDLFAIAAGYTPVPPRHLSISSA